MSSLRSSARRFGPLTLLGCLLMLPLAPICAVEIQPAANGGVIVTSPRYVATVDPYGNLGPLVVEGVEILGSYEGEAPAGGPVSVNIHGQVVSARNEARRIEYQFDNSSIRVRHEGAEPELRPGAGLTALVLHDGSTVPPSRATGDVVRFAGGETAVEFGECMHSSHGRIFPSRYTRGGNRAAELAYTIEVGLARHADFLRIGSLDSAHPDPKSAPMFEGTEIPTFRCVVENLGDRPANLEIRHRVTEFGDDVSLQEKTAPIEVLAKRQTENLFEYTPARPGFYRLEVALLLDGAEIKRERLTFIYRPSEFLPPLTRPADFQEFWSGQLAEARKTPPELRVERKPDRDSENHEAYLVEMTYLPGHRYPAFLYLPKKVAAPYQVSLGTYRVNHKPPESKPFKGEPDLAYFASPMPEEGTFRRWNSATDNNFLDCILIMVRSLDYLVSRGDVASIHLNGASRSGPIVLSAAALAPKLVGSVWAHVPTSMGISWEQPVYRGWGAAPRERRTDAASYLDPVNLAPDIRVPFLMDAGVDDGLSPAPGILAFYNHAVNAPWKRVAMERGGHGYFTSGNRQRFLDELAQYLGGKADNKVDDAIMREH